MINQNNKEDMLKSGIYAIVNLKNEKQYIGSTIRFKSRIKCHFNLLKTNKHDNEYLQYAFNKYGKDSFEFKIIECCDKDKCIEIEQKYLDQIFKLGKPRDKFYNICEKAGKGPILFGVKNPNYGKMKGNENPMYDKKHTEEAKKKMSKAKLGKKASDKSKKKMSEARMGNKNHKYVSHVVAENMNDGQKLKASSEKELAKLLSVTHSMIHVRINENSKRFTKSLMNGVWKIYRDL